MVVAMLADSSISGFEDGILLVEETKAKVCSYGDNSKKSRIRG